MSFSKLSIIRAAFLLVAASQPCFAQLILRDADCRSEHLAAIRSRPDTATAIIRLEQCGAAGGEILAGVMRANRHSQDTTLFNRLYRSTGVMMLDANVLSAAIEVATDPSASDLSRRGSLLTLLVQYHSFWIVKSTTQGKCNIGGHSEVMPGQGAKRPLDYRKQISTAIVRVTKEKGASPSIKELSTCIYDKILEAEEFQKERARE